MKNNIKKQNSSSCYEVMIHKLCNEKCYFCSQNHSNRVYDIRPSDNDIYKRILFGKKEGYGMIGFTGGEPLIHKNILKYIKFAKKVGFESIRIQTNGTKLSEKGFVKKCIESGVTFFKLSVHHYKENIHDFLVGLPGSLKKVKNGIIELKKINCRIGINIVLTKQNYLDLPEFLLYYLDMGVTSFVIIFPLYENSMKVEVEKVGIKFNDTVRPIVKALQIFDALGLKRPLVLNFPMCLLKGYEDSIIQDFNGAAVLNINGKKTNIDDNKIIGKKRVKICNGCKYNEICFGVDNEYLNVWGEGEFQEFIKDINLKFSIDDLKIKEYFSDNELCLIKILNYKNSITIEEIKKIKEKFQICKGCGDIFKIEKRLLKKGYIKVYGSGKQKIYEKNIDLK